MEQPLEPSNPTRGTGCLDSSSAIDSVEQPQLAAWITDNRGFSVSESTVYRILREEDLIKSPQMQLKAGKEYHRKTTGSNRCGPPMLPTSGS